MPPRPARWIAGKAPAWVEAEEDAPPAQEAPASRPAPVAGAAADPRLQRLTQRRGTAERRPISAAQLVAQRPAPPLVAASDAPHQRPADAAQEQRESEGEEEIAARRMAIRARQLAATSAPGPGHEPESEEEGLSSELTSEGDSGSEEEGPAMLKPAFVPRFERETLAEREAALAQAEQTTRQQAEELLDRQRQTQELLAHLQQQAAQQDLPAQDSSDLDTDDDGGDEVAEYEAWRQRELLRIARDREARASGSGGVSALGPGQQSATAAAQPTFQSKKKWKFLQKYWHKGAFFQTEGEEGEDVLGGIMRREYDAPTGEDKFDKQMLPKIMQVRNFGRRGRTKWSHLLNEDTSLLADGGVPPAQGRQPSRVQHDFAKPRQLPT